MATVPIKPGPTQVELTARTHARKLPPRLLNVPGGLYPLKSAAFAVDEYRLRAGWPMPVPTCDIAVPVLVSAEGTVLDSRDSPLVLTTGAFLRWVADSDYYDQTTLLWRPIQGESSPWQTSPANAPTLVTDYEYRIGDEQFTDRTVLNFDSNTVDYMWIDLDLLIGGVSGYTVVMVVSPNSVYGNDKDVIENGLWGPSTTDGSFASFTVRDQAVYMATEINDAQLGPAIGNGLVDPAPTFIALVVNRPQTTLYAASGPSDVLVVSLPAGSRPVPLSTRFWLGNTASVTSGTMDMALMDLGLYPNALSRSEVIAEITALSAVYGGDR